MENGKTGSGITLSGEIIRQKDFSWNVHCYMHLIVKLKTHQCVQTKVCGIAV